VGSPNIRVLRITTRLSGGTTAVVSLPPFPGHLDHGHYGGQRHRGQGDSADARPGAQLRFTDLDGHRLTAFATDTKRGQLADLELI
jgi:hypothetical protein